MGWTYQPIPLSELWIHLEEVFHLEVWYLIDLGISLLPN